jgi:hypothetical protein
LILFLKAVHQHNAQAHFHRHNSAGSAAGPFSAPGEPEFEDSTSQISVVCAIDRLPQVGIADVKPTRKTHERLGCENAKLTSVICHQELV